MKLVIDIPKNEYELIRHGNKSYITELELMNAVAKGTPLPKGHGRLIDEKEAFDNIAEGKDGKAYFGTVNKDWEVIDFLKTISTIVEADKECDSE